MPAVRSANLCWGQHHHLLRYHQVPAEWRYEAHITTSYPLPDGCTAADVRATLNYLVRRHEVLRTVYDLDARPWPRQLVQQPAPLTVPEVTTEKDGTSAPLEVIRELSETPFDISRDWPIRACVITTGGVLKRLHLVFNHLSFDDVSLDVLSGELDALLAARVERRPVVLPPVRSQPVDLARFESGRPKDAVDRALEHWRGEVRALPADMYARRRHAGAPGAAHSASFTVPALLSTARAIAGRHRVWPSAVHLAAYAVTSAAYTGEQLIAHRMYTSQRDASGFQSVLTCMSYPTLVVTDLSDDPPFSELLRRAATRVEQSMTHAHIPYDQIVEEISLESSRRGQPVRVASELNFLDNAPRSCRTRRDRLAWNAAPTEWAQVGSDTYFRIYEWSDGITLALQAMAEVMDRETVEQFLRGYARLVEAHRDPSVDLRVSQAVELMDFAALAARPMLLVGPDVVDPERTEAAMRDFAGVVSGRLTSTERGLVADIVADRPIDLAQLRTHVLGAMHDQPAARCPDWFQVTDIDRRTPVVAGAGMPVPPAPARTTAERSLTSVVAAVNGLTHVDPADSYAVAGGRALRLPQVMAALRELGWDGVSMRHLVSARPLRTLADRMACSRPTDLPCPPAKDR